MNLGTDTVDKGSGLVGPQTAVQEAGRRVARLESVGHVCVGWNLDPIYWTSTSRIAAAGAELHLLVMFRLGRKLQFFFLSE